MPKSNILHASSDLILKAVIFCDDTNFFEKANAALRRVGRSEASARWVIKSWPVNALSHPSKAAEALIEAADTHLIIIPARHACSLALGLMDWLRQWAALRQIPDAALAVISDGAHADAASTLSPELTLLVLSHDLNLIIESTAVLETLDPAGRIPSHRALSPPLELHRYDPAPPHDSFRRFGINE